MIPYTFSVLRYVHDPVTAEFANVGVALYAPAEKYLSAICTPHYGRLSQMFGQVEGDQFRQATRYIQTRIEILGERLRSELPLEESEKNHIQNLLAQVLPPDDTSLQFSPPQGGLTSNPEKTLLELYFRHVEIYAQRPQRPSREDSDVWRVFKQPLQELQVIHHLKPKRITAPNYDYEFERARKNGAWHLYEPVSFDLINAGSIREKANNWVGRFTSLRESPEEFKLHFLVGGPHDDKLTGAYQQAQRILHQVPCEIHREEEAEELAEKLKKEIEDHSPE